MPPLCTVYTSTSIVVPTCTYNEINLFATQDAINYGECRD